MGKKVLVLEQHYIAGGGCHTFKEKGYEFDTGLHYIAESGAMDLVNKIGAKKIELTSILTYDKYSNSPK